MTYIIYNKHTNSGYVLTHHSITLQMCTGYITMFFFTEVLMVNIKLKKIARSFLVQTQKCKPGFAPTPLCLGCDRSNHDTTAAFLPFILTIIIYSICH